MSYDSIGQQVCVYSLAIDKEIIDTITDRKQLTETDVHDIRVNLKRLRAMRHLSYFETGYSHFTAADTNLRDAGRLLSANRDQTVLRKTLKKLLKGADTKSQRRKVKAVLAHVRGSTNEKGVTDKSIHNGLKRSVLFDQRDWRKLQRDLDKTENLVSGLARTYEYARSLAEQISRRDKPTTSHRWRKWCKYLCYQLQSVSYLDPNNRRNSKRILDLKRLGSVLGWRHDIELLMHTLDEISEVAPMGEEVNVVKVLASEWDMELKEESEILSNRLFTDQAVEFAESVLAINKP
ncbi:MAG: CHAD domain-containing protein [Arenicellales bacterium]|nr:CHAD domain-containing protein [Arenicellales bacterium]